MPSGDCCPRCGNGKLFSGFIGLKPRCESCGLDYDFADAGDGPAIFIMLGGGALVVAMALWTEANYEPPFWVHALIFLPLALIVCLGMLRPIKAALIHQQYRTKAEQARLKR